MRERFVEVLLKNAIANPKIVLITGDLGYGVLDKFAEQLPNQYYNLGISEQSIMGIAAGIASRGFRPFVYSIANFPTFRCLEQIRNNVNYTGVPVTIVSVGAGVSYGTHGYTHHAIEDISIMRVFENIKIHSPSSDAELDYCLKQIIQNTKPAYLRLGRIGLASSGLHTTQAVSENPTIYQNGQNGVICWTGSIGKRVLAAARILADDGLKPTLISVPILNKSQMINCLKKFEGQKLVTIEENILEGGFGSWILELLNANKIKMNVTRLGFSREIVSAIGSEDFLLDEYGLSINEIANAFRN